MKRIFTQSFVNTVRSTGGNNTQRNLMLCTYSATTGGYYSTNTFSTVTCRLLSVSMAHYSAMVSISITEEDQEEGAKYTRLMVEEGTKCGISLLYFILFLVL
jgi:hypothetical protein